MKLLGAVVVLCLMVICFSWPLENNDLDLLLAADEAAQGIDNIDHTRLARHHHHRHHGGGGYGGGGYGGGGYGGDYPGGGYNSGYPSGGYDGGYQNGGYGGGYPAGGYSSGYPTGGYGGSTASASAIANSYSGSYGR